VNASEWADLQWIKSSRSAAHNACVELAVRGGMIVLGHSTNLVLSSRSRSRKLARFMINWPCRSPGRRAPNSTGSEVAT
jgi:Domain of unknown function (DUF397)